MPTTQKRKISAINKVFFKLGISEGEKNTRHLVRQNALLKRFAKEMWEVYAQEDEKYPSPGVCISFKMARSFIGLLKKGKNNPALKKKLQTCIDRAREVESIEIINNLIQNTPDKITK